MHIYNVGGFNLVYLSLQVTGDSQVVTSICEWGWSLLVGCSESTVEVGSISSMNVELMDRLSL